MKRYLKETLSSSAAIYEVDFQLFFSDNSEMLPDASAQNYSIFKPVIFDNGVNPFLMTKQHTILLLHSLFTLRELRVFRHSACAVVVVDMAGLANDPHGLAEDAKMH